MEQPPHDEQLTLHYREKRFGDMGFNAAEAQQLADSRVDVHAALELLGQGCPASIAFDILREFELA